MNHQQTIEMKTLKQRNRSAQWLAASILAITAAHSASAATVMIDIIDHDLSTTLSSVDFNGITDAGQWSSYNPATLGDPAAMMPGFPAQVSAKSADDESVIVVIGISNEFGTTTNYVGDESQGGVASPTSGLVAWNLSNGTRGWLHINNSGNVGTADYFIFDDADDQSRPDHLGNAEAFASVATTTLNASPVPEPSSIALLALGTIGLISRRSRQ